MHHPCKNLRYKRVVVLTIIFRVSIWSSFLPWPQTWGHIFSVSWLRFKIHSIFYWIEIIFESNPLSLSSDLEMITVWWDFIIFEKNQNRSEFFLDLMMKYQIHILIWSVYSKVSPDREFWDTFYKIQTFLVIFLWDFFPSK